MEIERTEVARHNSRKSCWIIINDTVYDVTEFLRNHPGGERAILVYAGKDASKEFTMLHRPGILQRYGKPMIVGKILK